MMFVDPIDRGTKRGRRLPAGNGGGPGTADAHSRHPVPQSVVPGVMTRFSVATP